MSMLSSKLVAAEATVGSLDKIEPFRSKFVQARNVHVWLPEGYSRSKEYAVLYMHDGQVLFDAKASWNGQEWGVDEVAQSLMSEGRVRDFIVVGIFNGAPLRHAEYFPQKPFESMSEQQRDELYGIYHFESEKLFQAEVQSDQYLRFMVSELKPYIDRTYPVKSDRENTFIMGSSMGGLISLYAVTEYPDIFSAAAAMSTHWPGVLPVVNSSVPEAFLNWLEQDLPDPDSTRIYFDHGTETLDKYYGSTQTLVDELMENKGFTNRNWKSQVFPGHAHTEDDWRKRLHIPLIFLLGTN